MKLTKSVRLNKLLEEMSIYDAYDVVYYLPYKYLDLTPSEKINFNDKEKVVLLGTIVSKIDVVKPHKITISKFDLLVKDKIYHITAFNRPYLDKSFAISDIVTILGSYNQEYNYINLINIKKGSLENESKYVSLYHLSKDYPNHLFSGLVKRSLNSLQGKIYDDIPYYLINHHHLIKKYDALYKVHFPSSKEDIKEGLKYLKYEEALKFVLKTLLIKNENAKLTKYKKEPIDIDICKDFINLLPFKLTDEQYKVSKEIIADMNKNTLMYRLLQGDVGSGKTIVSFLCLYANNLRGDQGVLMAPTDALARQHFENANKIFSHLNIRVELLTGQTNKTKRKAILDDLKDGLIDILIGTHALFSKDVIYSKLGLCVIDEQHRFGVNQRHLLASKGENCDILMMSATPIPRSLALSIYGDLDISSIHQLPFQNKKIITRIVKSDDKKIFDGIDYMLKNNRQVYVIVPLIDYESGNDFSIDTISAKYLLKYPNNVAILHGKLKNNEKEEALAKFYNHEVSILVSTLVVEVGIDVKNASFMVIYNASNFGLASLHQLRGRIGRDGYPSYCFLTYDGDDKDELNKLNVLVKSFDGFYIAEEDLKMRGPGELNGLRQSGDTDFKYLNLYNDIKIFQIARNDALTILKKYQEGDKNVSYIINKCQKEIKYEKFIKS